MNKQKLLALIDRYLAGEATSEEIDLLSRYYNSFQDHNNWNEMELGPKSHTEAEIFKRIREEIRANQRNNNVSPISEDEDAQEGRIIQLTKRTKLFSFRRIAVAASIIGVFILGIFYWFNREEKNEIVKTEVNKDKKKDVLPGGDKAILTLADGTTIMLNNAQNSTLTEQGGTQIIKLNGKLAYHPNGTGANDTVYNTLSTPRGGQYQVVLPDGSKVWLNAASSLHFPVAFTGSQREVELTGEAYFEVAKNKKKPFRVKVGGMSVNVLGTHFNINAYTDEETIKTSLLEGSVKITKGNVTGLLKPGQQAVLNKKEDRVKITKANLNEVMAWKNGLFQFEDADITDIMRQISRWYDVEVVYAGKVPTHRFEGKISRRAQLSQVLHILELSNVKFTVEDKKIIVQ